MNLDEILETALIFLAVVIATYSVVSFTSIEVVSSPLTVSVLILLVGFGAHLALVSTDERTLKNAGYIILSVYLISVITYLLTVFSITPLVRSIVLILLSGGILAGVYARRNEIDVLSERNLKVVIGVLIITSTIFVGIDTLTDEPSEELVVADSISSTDDGDKILVAQIRAENPSVLPKGHSGETYVACVGDTLWDPNGRVRENTVGYENLPDGVIWDERSEDIVLPSEVIDTQNASDIELVKTERCPSDLGENTIAVYESS